MDLTTLTAAQRDAMKSYGVRVVTGVDTEPVTLGMAWAQLKIVPDGDPLSSPYDDWLETIGIPAAREYCENYSGLSIGLKVLELGTNGFPEGGIQLLSDPVDSVSMVTYIDGEGVTNVMDEAAYELSYVVVNNFSRLWYLNPAYGTSWPAARNSANSVRVEYTVGYTAENPIPGVVRSAVLVMLGHLDANREDTTPVAVHEIPNGVKCFLDQVRVQFGMA